MLRKFLPLSLLIFAVTLSAPAQEKSKLAQFGLKMLASLTEPKEYLDSAYVLQPRLKWMVAVEGSTIHTSMNLHSNLTISDFTGDKASITQGAMDIGMSNNLYKKVGLSVEYGSMSAGYGVELGKKDTDHNTYFSFGTMGTFYGFSVQYYKTHQYVTGGLNLGEDVSLDLSSEYPGEMRNFSLTGYYAFNRKKFVLESAYSGRPLQRRSAGSWLVTAKYMQGDFSFSPDDAGLIALLNDLHRYSTWQISFGGGYSFNWVLFHKDPVDCNNWKGLRNLTLNATLQPMVSFFTHIDTEQGEGADLKKVRYQGPPSITPAALGAISYAWSRYHITIQAGYSRFNLNSVDTDDVEKNGLLRTKISTQGVFHDLSAKMKIGVRF